MISFEKLCFIFVLLAIILFLPTNQNVLQPDSFTIQEPSAATSPANSFIELSTSSEGIDEREEDLIDGVIIRVGFSKNMGKALQKFKKLSNPTKFVKRIVSEVFQEGPQNGDRIIQFINLLSDIETKYFAIWTLHEEMLLADKFDAAYDASSVLREIQHSTKFEDFSEFDKRNVKVLLKSFEKMDGKENAQKRKLLQIRQEKIEKMQLQNSSLEIEESEKNQEIVLHELQSKLQPLVEDVDQNFRGIFKVAQEIRAIEKNLDDDNKIFFEAMKKQIPETIALLAWQEPSCIKMAKNGYYMYAKEDDYYFKGMSVSTDGKKPSTGYHWTFELDDNKKYFYLKNYNFKRYFYGNLHYTTSKGIQTYNNCCKQIWSRNKKLNLLTDKWTIELIKGGTEMYIKNVEFSQYLSSDALFTDENQQTVYLYSEADSFTIEKC